MTRSLIADGLQLLPSSLERGRIAGAFFVIAGHIIARFRTFGKGWASNVQHLRTLNPC